MITALEIQLNKLKAAAGIEGTLGYLRWLDTAFRASAERGDDMNDVLRLPVPPPWRQWAAFDTEYIRNVSHLYPRYEAQVLAGRR
jgi:hypothetical protein